MNRHNAPFRIAQILFLTSAMILAGKAAFGQAAAARPDRGITPSGSYAISDIERINLENGNLGLSIPLASMPPIAGGKLGFTLRAEYNSKNWDTIREELLQNPIDPSSKYVTTSVQLPGNGWIIGGAYSIAFENVQWDYDYHLDSNDPEYNDLNSSVRWTKVILATPDGAKHELRPLDYSSYADGYNNHNYLRGYYRDNPNTVSASLRYYSFDGSHLWAKIDPAQYLFSGDAPSWTVYLPDGTRIEQASGIQRMIDTNGNKIKIFTGESNGVYTTHYQDELTGREIRSIYDPSGNSGQGQAQVQYQTVAGAWMTIHLNFGTTQMHGKAYAFGDPDCSEGSYPLGQTITVLRSIVFPETEPNVSPRQFSFAYNSDTSDTVNQEWYPSPCTGAQTITSTSHGLGSLSQITMPSGAVINYEYQFDGQVSFMDPNDLPRESLVTKQLVHDNTSETWTYFTSPGGGGFNAPDGSFVGETMYPSDRAFANNNAGFGGKEGLVYRTNQSNKVLVEKHWTLMNFGGENIAPGAGVQVTFNPVVNAEYTTLLDDTSSHNPIKMSARTYTFDYNGNQLTETDYDWFDPALVSRDAQGIPTGVPSGATVLRSVSNEYYNDSTSSSSGNVYARQSLSATSPLIQNALKRAVTGPAEVRLSYDSNSYGTAPSVGNLTSKSVFDDVDNTWITTSMTYGTYGNLASTTDGRGKITYFYYDDLPYAAPNRVVVNPDNGTGAQTMTTAYDYYTGLVTSSTDVNGKTATVDYINVLLNSVDPFGRPGITKAPAVTVNGSSHQQRVTTKYFDSMRQVIVASDLYAENDQLLKTRTTADMLGRPVLTEQTEDGTNYTIAAYKVYDTVNRITYSSSPWRSSSFSTDSWTRVTSDILGRATEVATFGGASQPPATGTTNVSGFTGKVSTDYDANFTTVTDQAGKVRRSKVDALGRLIRVDEPNSSGSLGTTSSPNQPTSYQYDVLGNLTTVTQDSQAQASRSFTYDSLSRLRTAFNPESGTLTYTYDENGNLHAKVDARSITSTFAYDSLNRVTSRSYSDSTPTVTYTYDTATNGKGRLASVSSTVSSYSYSGYDATGKASGATQAIGSRTYSLTYGYDLSGHVTSITYPSGHLVNYNYDNAGRLADRDSNNLAFSGTLGDNTARTYSRGISYTPGGQMTQERLGTATAIYNKLFYNSRGQLAEIREGLSANNDSSERGAIINFYSDHCWGMCTPTQQNDGSMPDNNGNLLKQEIDVPGSDHFSVQWFVYDSLNRLKSANEVDYPYAGGSQERWRQTYIYDRFGNRTIDQNSANTFGDGIPKPNFSVITASNRLGVPSGYSGTMHYDSAGNLDVDTYSAAAVSRLYDAENRMTKETQASSYVAGEYSYDGDGRRVKRKVGGVETWQVYGLGGELLAEYAANASYTTPQKEYGYRNGQLLVTVTCGSGYGDPPVLHDNPLVVGETTVQARHITELRTAINALRVRAGMSAYSWTTSATTSDWLSAAPIVEMRTAVDQVLGPPSSGYSSGLASGQPIKAVHIQELRDRLTTAWGIDIRWLVTDHLGTPRMIFDQSGSLSGVSRHDYLPFGEELFAGIGGRTTSQGYSLGDGARQKFTSKERDLETGLDYFESRYYESAQGRFTSVDPLMASARASRPQSWNRYAYCYNNPLRFIDNDGMDILALDKKAMADILSTLPEVIRQQVKKSFDDKGYLKQGGLDHIESKDQNFLDLKELVNFSKTTEVGTASGYQMPGQDAQEFSYQSPNEVRQEALANIIKNGVPAEDAANMIKEIKFDVVVHDGVTLSPSESPSGNLRVLIADQTGKTAGEPSEDIAVVTGHELYVHARLYQEGKAWQHAVEGGPSPSLFLQAEERSRINFRGQQKQSSPQGIKPKS